MTPVKRGNYYYVTSDDYEGLDPISLVYVDTIDEDGIYCILEDNEGNWDWSGYIKEQYLMTASEILEAIG